MESPACPHIPSAPPSGGRLIGVKKAAVMGQHQEHVKNLETDSGKGQEMDGDQLVGMILEEGTPSLRGRFVGAQHVFADTGLSDVDAEFEQFAMDAGRTPAGWRADY